MWAENQYEGLANFMSLSAGGDPKVPSSIYFFKKGLYLYN